MVKSSDLPSSASACSTHFRIETAVGSNSLARLSGVRPARTSSTFRRRNSAGYGDRLFGIVVSFLPQRERVSTKPGQLQYEAPISYERKHEKRAAA